MTAAELLSGLRALGATVSLDGDRVRVTQAAAIPPPLRTAVTMCKAELVELLRREHVEANTLSVQAVTDGAPSLSWWITSQDAVAALADAIVKGAPEPVAVAMATTGPDPLLHSPVLLAVGLAEGTQHVVNLREVRDLGPLLAALQRVRIVGHSLQRTLAFLQYHYRVAPTVMADAEILSKLFGGGANLKTDEHSLDALARRWLKRELPPERSTAGLAQFDPMEAHALANRVWVLRPLVDHLAREVNAAKLRNTAKLEHQILATVVATSLYGVGLDADRFTAVIADRNALMADDEATLHAALGDVSLDDDEAVLKALHRYGLHVEKTGKDALASHLHDPVAQALVRRQRLVAFGRDLGLKIPANAAQYLDGRVRSKIDPLGAATGRLTYSAPNLQGIEKGDALRNCIVPAPGNVFVVGDYAAIDLRALANHTLDPALVADFKAGKDPHRATAARIAKKSIEQVTDEERRPAKAINFGVVYGMGAEKFALYQFTNFQQLVTVNDAQRMLDDYRRAHPKVAEWQDLTRLAHSPELHTVSGRLRRFSKGDSIGKRLNFPIQGTVADGLKRALINLWGALPPYAHVVLTVHDEIVVECPREHAAEVAVILEREMEAGMAAYVKAVPIVAEVTVRATWAESSKIILESAP